MKQDKPAFNYCWILDPDFYNEEQSPLSHWGMTSKWKAKKKEALCFVRTAFLLRLWLKNSKQMVSSGWEHATSLAIHTTHNPILDNPPILFPCRQLLRHGSRLLELFWITHPPWHAGEDKKWSLTLQIKRKKWKLLLTAATSFMHLEKIASLAGIQSNIKILPFLDQGNMIKNECFFM